MMKQRTKNIIDTIIAVVIAAIFLFPMYWIIISSLKSDTEIFCAGADMVSKGDPLGELHRPVPE